MITSQVARFFEQLPFEPFTLVLVDGRELHVHHRDFVQLGRRILFVMYLQPTGQLEVIDTSLIVSIRTIYATDIAGYQEHESE